MASDSLDLWSERHHRAYESGHVCGDACDHDTARTTMPSQFVLFDPRKATDFFHNGFYAQIGTI